MVAVTITFLVEDLNEVTEAVAPITQQLQTVPIPPVGSMYVKNMANEKGSTVSVRVELVPEHDANMLRIHKPKITKELLRN